MVKINLAIEHHEYTKMRLIDIAGQQFTRLTAIAIVDRIGRRPRWICRCVCGNEIIVEGAKLRNGHTQSCGCLRADRCVERSLRHGHSRPGNHSPTHNSWRAMQTRCDNFRQKDWDHYGARVIIVCERWRSFENFLADMGERPEGHTIDRINVDGNYEPTNCRWATAQEQRRNQRL